MSKLVTVIVPVYNVQEYVIRSIKSIITQSYSNLEIILVDDGSTDKSGEICDAFAQKDGRINVIHKKNGGQGSARNVALDRMTGEYVLFLDSDDFLESECIKELVQLMEKHNLDISVCNYNFIDKYNKKKGTFSKILGYKEYNGFEVLQHMWNDEIINIAPWAKLYRASLWEGFRFVECYCEDSATMYKLYKKEMKIGYTGKPLVNYVLRESSDVRSFSEKKLYMLDIYDDVVEYAKKNLPEYLQRAANSKQVAVCFHVLFQMPLNIFSEEKKRIHCTIKKRRKNVMLDVDARMKTRIACVLSYFGLPFTKLVFNGSNVIYDFINSVKKER